MTICLTDLLRFSHYKYVLLLLFIIIIQFKPSPFFSELNSGVNISCCLYVSSDESTHTDGSV